MSCSTSPTCDPQWEKWSVEALAQAAEAGVLAINPIIYAEASIGFTTIQDLDEALPPTCMYEPRFPTSYIGAHAAIAGCRLLTRDVQRYRTYFPTVHLTGP